MNNYLDLAKEFESELRNFDVGSIREFPVGSQISMETFSFATKAWWVRRGEMCLMMSAESGKQSRIMTFAPGDVGFCFPKAFLLGFSYSVDFRFVSDCQCLMISKEELSNIICRSKTACEFVNSCYARITETLIERIGEVTFMPLKDRLLKYLQEKEKSKGDTISVTHEELAYELGSSREVISRLLKQLSDEGLVTCGRKSIILKNIDK